MKLMYDLIRLVHHFGKITTKVVGNSPNSFRRLTQHLINTVKPVVSTKKVMQLLEGNARNWPYTIADTLRPLQLTDSTDSGGAERKN